MRKSGYVIVGVFTLVLLTSGTLIAQPSTATFNLTGLSSGSQLLAGEFTSPYLGTINGGPTTAVICDDIADNAVIPQEWTAYSTSLSSITSGAYGTPDPYLKFGTSGPVTGSDAVTPLGWSLSQTQAYEVAALLAIDILSTTGSVEADYTYALWGLFDSTDSFTAALDAADESNAETYLNNAINEVVTSPAAVSSYLSNYDVTIYTYVPPSSGGMNPLCGPGLSTLCTADLLPPQEFITVPEASTPVLLAVDLLGFMALVGFLRKRVSQSV